MTENPRNRPGWVTCATCGKIGYLTRKLAKRARRKNHFQGDDHMNIYRCGSAYHIGHLATSVITGRVTRRDVYGEGA